MKKTFIAFVILMLAATIVLSACGNTAEESTASTEPSQETSSAVSSEEPSAEPSEEPSEEPSTEPSKAEESKETSKTVSEEINNEPTEYLNVYGCSYTDDEYQSLMSDKSKVFVVVGQCEEGATITAETPLQTVTCGSYYGWYTVRLKSQGSKTRVKITAKGDLTEAYTFDAKPKTPSSDMWPIVSADGYRFFFQKMMPDYTHKNTLSASQQSTLTSRIKTRVNQLKAKKPDAEIVYMIVPSAATVYSDEVPDAYKQGSGDSRLDQVMDCLSDAGAMVIDLKELFAQHKDDEYGLFWRTDSHWSEYGAFVAYTELFNQISELFPDAKPRSMLEFDWKGDYYYAGDMLYYVGMDWSEVKEYGWLRVPEFELSSSLAACDRYRSDEQLAYHDVNMTKEASYSNNDSSLPNLYVIRDSYSTQIYDILAERANNCYYKSMWSYTYNINDVVNRDTDYIIYIVSEWNIDSIISG